MEITLSNTTHEKIVYGMFQMVKYQAPHRTTALEIMQQMAHSSELFREVVRDVVASQTGKLLESFDDTVNFKVQVDWRPLGKRKDVEATRGAPLSALSGQQGTPPSYDPFRHSVIKQELLNV